MALIDRDELGTESESDDGDVEFSAHGFERLKHGMSLTKTARRTASNQTPPSPSRQRETGSIQKRLIRTSLIQSLSRSVPPNRTPRAAAGPVRSEHRRRTPQPLAHSAKASPLPEPACERRPDPAEPGTQNTPQNPSLQNPLSVDKPQPAESPDEPPAARVLDPDNR